MNISLCIPVHNRTHDLRKTMPHLLETANASAPVEIVIIDYNSEDNLQQYIHNAKFFYDYAQGVTITYRLYEGRHYYHMAHARNLSVLAASGEYIVILSADIYIDPDFIHLVRKGVKEHGYIWMGADEFHGVVAIKRSEFIASGGYDERFEFYGPEDRDLADRLRRRGAKFGELPRGLIHVHRTSNEDKIKNYRLPISKDEMSRLMRPIYDENVQQGALIANPRGWGAWE